MKKRQTFVFIHGAWHGGWCWSEVRRQLELEGHQVFTPTLPGHAERAAEQPISLERYISDLFATLRLKRLQDATLVGHSMAGILLPALVERMMDHFKRIVYVAAFVLASGEAMTDYLPQKTIDFYNALALEGGDGRIALSAHVAMQALYNRCSPDTAQESIRRMTPQPYAPFKEKVKDGYQTASHLTSAVILATDDRAMPHEVWTRFSERVRPDRYAEVDGDHMMMISNPGGFVEKLLEVTS